MTSAVLSLTGARYIDKPESIIAYQLNRYQRMPANTMPVFSDMFISLPLQVARFGSEPENLTKNMQSDLQRVFDRIFGQEREVKVTVTYELTGPREFNVTTNIIYSQISGEIGQTGTTITLVNGLLVTPEYNIQSLLTG